MQVKFVYNVLPVFYIEVNDIRQKCVESYGPIIVSETSNGHNNCGAKRRLHHEYAKQFYRTIGLRPLLNLLPKVEMLMDIDAHGRYLASLTGFSTKELATETNIRAKLIHITSAKKEVPAEEIKKMLEAKIKKHTGK